MSSITANNSLEVSLGRPLDYGDGKSSRPSHFNLSLTWDWDTRKLAQARTPTLRFHAGETVHIPTGPDVQLESRLDPLWLRREVYSDLGCKIVVALDDLVVAGRREEELSQKDRDEAAYILLKMLMLVDGIKETKTDSLQIQIDADSYEDYQKATARPKTKISYPNMAEGGEYAHLAENEARVVLKTPAGSDAARGSSWAWNMNSRALRPMKEGQATRDTSDMQIDIEACRRLDPNFLARYQDIINYKVEYDIETLKRLHREIAEQAPLSFSFADEQQELCDCIGRAFYKLLFGDPDTRTPIGLQRSTRLKFEPIKNFGRNITITPMFAG